MPWHQVGPWDKGGPFDKSIDFREHRLFAGFGEKPISDYTIAETMRIYGGGFVRVLGTLFHLADPVNQAKLKAAFPEYWTEYAELAALKAKSA